VVGEPAPSSTSRFTAPASNPSESSTEPTTASTVGSRILPLTAAS
jgi:hypothetical protein